MVDRLAAYPSYSIRSFIHSLSQPVIHACPGEKGLVVSAGYGGTKTDTTAVQRQRDVDQCVPFDRHPSGRVVINLLRLLKFKSSLYVRVVDCLKTRFGILPLF